MTAQKRGRPPSAKPKGVNVSLRLESDLKDAVEVAAAKDNRPVSQWLRMAVKEKLERQEGKK